MADAYYSNVALPTTLSGSISSGATTITVGATTGFPGSFPYTLALDYGAGTEELVQVTAAAGTNLTVVRGFSGTSAQSHSLGAAVRHVYHAGDASDFRSHQDATTDIHGVTGALVGATQTQTLTNKTLTSPTINSGTLAGGALSGTFTGSPTFSGAPTFTGGATFSTLSALFERAAVTDNAIRARITGDTNSRLLINADGKMIWGSGAATGDVNLYRADVGILATEDTIRAIGSATSSNALETRVSGDTANRYLIESNGGMGWGDGTNALDVSLGRTAAGVLTVAADLVVTGDLTVNGVGQSKIARKAANTNRSSTTTPAADPHLTLAVEANASYLLEGVIFYTSTSTTPDMILTVEGPSGSSGTWTMTAPSTTVSGDPDTVRVISSGLGTARSYGVPIASSVFAGQLAGSLLTSATAGNVFISWSQNSSSATATTVSENSWIRLTRVS